MKNYISNCCGAEVKVEGYTTPYYVCIKCGKMCDFEGIKYYSTAQDSPCADFSLDTTAQEPTNDCQATEILFSFWKAYKESKTTEERDEAIEKGVSDIKKAFKDGKKEDLFDSLLDQAFEMGKRSERKQILKELHDEAWLDDDDSPPTAPKEQEENATQMTLTQCPK